MASYQPLNKEDYERQHKKQLEEPFIKKAKKKYKEVKEEYDEYKHKGTILKHDKKEFIQAKRRSFSKENEEVVKKGSDDDDSDDSDYDSDYSDDDKRRKTQPKRLQTTLVPNTKTDKNVDVVGFYGSK